ncbi:hypothetical protein T492DRAFT_985854 [Pavlovales sp. CCMP2436]|nr:hypothetical protein T492DRAFT_985854 [Pavlovales sp. CCMP2436]
MATSRTVVLLCVCTALLGSAAKPHAGTVDQRFAALRARGGEKCYAAFLFHVEKCAGTTFRKHFERLPGVANFRQGTVVFLRRDASLPLVRHERCSAERSWFREENSCTWDQLVCDLEEHPPGGGEARRHVFVELAAMTSATARRPNLEHIIHGIERVRATWQPRGCEVVLFGLLREPVSHLLATYNYFVTNEQGRMPGRFGRSFGEWTGSRHVHNLQSRLLEGEPVIRIEVDPLVRSSRTRAQRLGLGLPRSENGSGGSNEHHLPRYAQLYSTMPADVHARQPRLLETLARFDLLAPMGCFDEVWFLLARRLGLRNLRYHMHNQANFTRMQRQKLEARGKLGDRQKLRRPDAMLVKPPWVLSLDVQQAEWLWREKLSADVSLYANVSAAWGRFTASLDAPTRRDMAEFVRLMSAAREEQMLSENKVVELWNQRERSPNATSKLAQWKLLWKLRSRVKDSLVDSAPGSAVPVFHGPR